MTAYFLIITDQNLPENSELKKIKDNLISEKFQKSLRETTKVSEILSCVIYTKPKTVDSDFYYSWRELTTDYGEQFEGLTEKLRETSEKVLPSELARTLAADSKKVSGLTEIFREIPNNVRTQTNSLGGISENLRRPPETINEIAENSRNFTDNIRTLPNTMNGISENVRTQPNIKQETDESFRKFPSNTRGENKKSFPKPEHCRNLTEDVRLFPENTRGLSENGRRFSEIFRSKNEDFRTKNEDSRKCPDDTRVFPTDLAARFIAANIHYLCEKIHPNFQFIKVFIYLSDFFYTDVNASIYLYEALSRLKFVYCACVKIFWRHKITDSKNIFSEFFTAFFDISFNFTRSHFSLYYHDIEKNIEIPLVTNFSLKIQESNNLLFSMRNRLYFLAFLDKNELPICFLEGPSFELSICESCKNRGRENFSSTFENDNFEFYEGVKNWVQKGAAIVFKCLLLDQIYLSHDWSYNMTMLWKSDLARMIGEAYEIHPPLHRSFRYAVGFPTSENFKYSCHFVNTDMVHSLGRIIGDENITNDINEIFIRCSFGAPNKNDSVQDGDSSRINKLSQSREAIEKVPSVENIISVNDVSVEPKKDFKNIYRSFSLESSQQIRVESKLKLIVDKVLEKKYSITKDSDLYNSCSKKLLVISKTYLKDIKITTSCLEKIVKIVKDNAAQIVEFEKENRKK